jgi:hypothetical protein
MPGGAEVGAMRLLMGHSLHHGDLLCIPSPVPPIGLISRESDAKESVSDTNTLMTNMYKRMKQSLGDNRDSGELPPTSDQRCRRHTASIFCPRFCTTFVGVCVSGARGE